MLECQLKPVCWNPLESPSNPQRFSTESVVYFPERAASEAPAGSREKQGRNQRGESWHHEGVNVERSNGIRNARSSRYSTQFPTRPVAAHERSAFGVGNKPAHERSAFGVGNKRRCLGPPANRCGDPGHEIARHKRLHDVVVCLKRKGLSLFCGLAVRGEHHHRHVLR